MDFADFILHIILLITACVGIYEVCAYAYKNHICGSQSQVLFIESYVFDMEIHHQIKTQYPHLTDLQITLLLAGLKEYFLICHQHPAEQFPIPSKALDFAWRTFILKDEDYQYFCQRAFGHYLQHAPIMYYPQETKAEYLLWHLAQQREKRGGIYTKQRDSVPFIFRIDLELGIEDGCFYRSAHPLTGHIGNFQYQHLPDSQQVNAYSESPCSFSSLTESAASQKKSKLDP